MPSHYVQYHKLSHDNPLPTDFAARTKKPGAVTAGDAVWLLVGVPSSGRTRFYFAYWFVAQSVSGMSDGTTRLRGESGERLDPVWSVSTELDPWFGGFFKSALGSGAFGFSGVPSEQLSLFEAKMVRGDPHRTEPPDDDIATPDAVDDRQWQSILTRRGQKSFRQNLIDVYGARCAVSESRVVPLLEAAHILPHAEGSDYRVANGILLRTDIHTLFDLHLLGIDASLRVHLKDSIRNSEFARFHGKRVETLPASTEHQPSPATLHERFQRFLAESS
jgi:hypothetical protein